MRERILAMTNEEADPDGTIALKRVVDTAQERYPTRALFPKGRVRNHCTFTKVDIEARCEIERIPGSSPQRITRWRDG